MSPRETIEKQKQKANGHSERSTDSPSLDTSGDGNFVRSNDALNGRAGAFCHLAPRSRESRNAKCNEKTVCEWKCSDCRTMDSRLFADTRRSCLFIQIDFSALRAMKSCLVRSRLAVCLTCAALCSCASVSLKKADVLTARAPTRTPEKIFVKPPEFYDAAVRVDRSGDRL